MNFNVNHCFNNNLNYLYTRKMSVHQVAPADIICLTSDESISISTIGETVNDSKSQLSLLNLLIKPETK